MHGIGKQLVVLVVLLCGAGAIAYIFYNPHPCLEPLRYSIGRVDEEFGLATTTFHAIIAEAEEPWETAAGRDLFMYDPTAEFTVNLIFDERQEFTNESREVREELQELQAEREEIRERHQALNDRYDREKEDFESMKEALDESLRKYNEDVEGWNERGGAPPAVAEELRGRQSALEAQQVELQEKQREVNALVDEINRVVRQEQAIVEAFNKIVEVYRIRHGDSREFEQGHATNNEINVYQFLQREDLRLVLAHEFGHTLGIGHVDNPEALMHRLMQEQSSDTIVLTEADLEELSRVCQDASYWSWSF